MLQTLLNLVHRSSTRKTFLSFLLAYSIYFPIFFFSNVPFGLRKIQAFSAGTKILDLETYYTGEQAYQRLALFGEQGRTVYFHILLGDLVYPFLLGSLLCISITLLIRRLNPSNTYWYLLGLLPLANMFFDYLEDALILTLLRNYPHQLPLLASTAGVVTFTKNMFGLLGFSALGFALVAIPLHWFKSRHV